MWVTQGVEIISDDRICQSLSRPEAAFYLGALVGGKPGGVRAEGWENRSVASLP